MKIFESDSRKNNSIFKESVTAESMGLSTGDKLIIGSSDDNDIGDMYVVGQNDADIISELTRLIKYVKSHVDNQSTCIGINILAADTYEEEDW